jgi:hypothetical protein
MSISSIGVLAVGSFALGGDCFPYHLSPPLQLGLIPGPIFAIIAKLILSLLSFSASLRFTTAPRFSLFLSVPWNESLHIQYLNAPIVRRSTIKGETVETLFGDGGGRCFLTIT